MKTIYLLLYCGLLKLTVSHAQSIDRNTISSFSQSHTQLCSTAGETRVGTYQNTYILTDGFNQPNILITPLDKELNQDLKVYPNPVVNNLRIESELALKSIKLSNIAGQELISFDGETQNIISLETFTPGTYLLSIELANTKKFRKYKIIKQ